MRSAAALLNVDRDAYICHYSPSVVSMDLPPFTEAHQLNEQLDVRVSKAPGEALGLRRTDAKLNTLPGQPRIPLEGCKLLDHLREELLVPQLDQIASKLWLVCDIYWKLRARGNNQLVGLDAAKFPHICTASPGCPWTSHPYH